MPNKSHKAASRQSKLGKKKRRSKARTQIFDAGPTEPDIEPPTAAARLPVENGEVTAVSQIHAPQKASQPVPEYTGKNIYLASELRRISVITFLIVSALTALTFVLR